MSNETTATTTTWHYQIGSKVYGPFSFAQMQQICVDHKISKSTPVKSSKMQGWQTAANIPILSECFEFKARQKTAETRANYDAKQKEKNRKRFEAKKAAAAAKRQRPAKRDTAHGSTLLDFCLDIGQQAFNALIVLSIFSAVVWGTFSGFVAAREVGGGLVWALFTVPLSVVLNLIISMVFLFPFALLIKIEQNTRR